MAEELREGLNRLELPVFMPAIPSHLVTVGPWMQAGTAIPLIHA